MKYDLDTKQIITESNKIKQELQYSKIFASQKRFVKEFIKNNKKNISFFILLVIVEVAVGLSLPIISQFYLKNSFDLLDYQTFYITVFTLLGLTVLFMFNSYYRILTGENITMKFINEIREAWFLRYLSKASALSNEIDAKKIMTKFLYHVQLLKLGFTTIVNEGLQAAFLYIGILIYSFIFNSKLFLILFLAAPLLVIVFLITYFIGKFYVSREQTFNTKIVRLLTDSALNFDLYKLQNREDEKLKEMEKLIGLDTHFRIRRQLWIKFSNRLLYGIVLTFGIGLYVIQTFWPFFEFDSITSVASTGIILGFFSMVLFATSRIGIFFEAFRLGIKIAVPDFAYSHKDIIKKKFDWKDLVIKSKKTKISYYSKYIKNLEIPLTKGDRVLFHTPEPLGKTTLAQIITGQKCADSFMFHIDKKRTPSIKWCDSKSTNYLISPTISFDTTVGEVLFGKNNLSVSAKELENSISKLKKYDIFNFIFDHKDTLGKKASLKKLSTTQRVLLHIAHCLVNNKQLIAVDHTCFDSLNDQVLKGLKLLDSQNPDSTILFFDSQKNNHFEYAKTFAIYKDDIKEA